MQPATSISFPTFDMPSLRLEILDFEHLLHRSWIVPLFETDRSPAESVRRESRLGNRDSSYRQLNTQRVLRLV